MKRIGISPLIASVLLLAFTMSIAMLAGPFFSNLMTDAQGDTSDRAANVQSATEARFSFQEATYSSNDSEMTVTIQNTGTSPVGNYTVTAYADTPAQKSLNTTLEAGEVQTVTMNVSSEPESIEVSARDAPVSMEEELTEENLLTGSAPSSPTGLSLST